MELILVMVVIAVVLGLAAPSLKGFFASRQTSYTAQTMLALTRHARSQAMAQGNICRLNIDTAAKTYWLTTQKVGKFVTLDTEMGRQFNLPEGATVTVQTPEDPTVQHSDAKTPDVLYVQFYPNGRCDVATIEVTGRQGDVYQIASTAPTETFRITAPKDSR
jgi:Tfp pilus assembly protein FimT